MTLIDPKNILRKRITHKEVIFVFAILLCLLPWVTPPVALIAGILVTRLSGHPFIDLNHKIINILLKASVVGLGFSMNIHAALQTGREGFIFTLCSIAGTLSLGILLGKWFHTERKTSHLIASGTAICGGSAIAAISPVINAQEKQISVALGVVFILNAIALLLFPVVGHWLDMSQFQFGLWSAIAIHDTSSVVGAASKYGMQALQVATTVKLARALWIIPATFLSAVIFKSKQAKMSIPYFIGLFILAILINTYLPVVHYISPMIVTVSKTGLTITLFLIGAGLTKASLKLVGWKVLLQATILWVVISIVSLYVILHVGQ